MKNPVVPYQLKEDEYSKHFKLDILSNKQRIHLAREGYIWACAKIVNGVWGVDVSTVCYDDLELCIKACMLHNTMAVGMTKDEHLTLIAQHCINR